MRIGIDYISSFGTGGNGTYSRELLAGLGRAKSGDEFMLYTYLHHVMPSARYAPPFSRMRFSGVYLPSFNSPLLTQLAESASRRLLRIRVSRDKLDVMHFTNPLFFVKNLPRSTRVAVTIHDLSFLKNPSWVRAGTHMLIMQMLDDIFREAHALIAVSEYTRRDIIAYAAETESKIFVVPEGVSDVFKPTPPDKAFLAGYGIIGPYVLSVGEIQPRKNLETILAAYAKLPGALRAANRLVLVGSPRDARRKNELVERIRALKLENRVIILGHVPIEDLVRLYMGAVSFIFASHYEGFGLPVLEAMACGTPVISSNATSLPEVGGDAVRYASPDDADGFARHLEEVLSDEKLRVTMRKKGLERAAQFSWDAAARKTLAAYRNIIA